MINYVQKFAPGLSELIAPIRDLFKSKNQFMWDKDVHGKCLLKIKAVLIFTPVDRLYKTTSKHVIQKLRAQFSRHGVPSKVISDNGPQFSSSDFADFAKTYEFVHVTSSPGYPQSNGKVENAVKTVKRIMKKSLKLGEDPFLALLSWRKKPKIATHVKKEMTVRKNKQKQYYDRNAKSLSDLEKGDIVRIRPQGRDNEWKLEAPRSL
jgi:hypothetical protein